MTSSRLKFRPSRVEGKMGTLYIQVIHNRLMRQIGMGCKLYPHEWENGQVKMPSQDSERRCYLLGVQDYLQKSMERLDGIIRRMEQSGEEYTADQVVEVYKLPDDDEGKLLVFVSKVAQHLRNIGKTRLSETYTSSVNSFMRFRGEKGDIRMDEMDSDLMKEYEHYLLDGCGLKRNTSSFYMRNLRALYNRAVNKGLVEDCHPFRGVYTGVDKTAKKAVPAEVIRRIRKLDLSMYPVLEQSRDYFLLLFYLRGISFVDVSQLKVGDLQGGMLTYRRQKTDQPLSVKWEKQMQEIVVRYHRSGSPYLLPIISDISGNGRRQYQNGLHRMNIHLKTIGRMVGCSIPLSTYCARHGWASIAQSMNVPLAVISQSMGHTSERTTRIYLASLDNAIIDNYNRKIIDAV